MLYQQVRDGIVAETDKALAAMQTRQEALEKKLEARTLEVQDLKSINASQPVIDQTLAEIAVLRQSLAQEKASRDEAVEKLLASAEQRQQEALKAAQDKLRTQEAKHVEALQAVAQNFNETLSVVTVNHLQKLGEVSRMVSNTLQNASSETATATREGFKELKDCIVASSSKGEKTQQQIADALSTMASAFESFVAADAAKQQRKLEAKKIKMLKNEQAAQQRALQDAKRDQQWSEAFQNTQLALNTVCSLIPNFSQINLAQAMTTCRTLSSDQDQKVKTMYKTSLRLEGTVNVLAGAPVKSLPQLLAPAGQDSAGSSSMHAAQHQRFLSLHRSTSLSGPALEESQETVVAQPQQQQAVTTPAEAFQQFLRDHPAEAQRILSTMKQKTKKQAPTL